MLDTPNARSDPSASKKGTKIMNKNIRLLLSAGSVAILAISALQGCGSDDPAPGGGAGAPGAGAPGAGAGGAHTAGAGGASAGAPAGGAPAGGASGAATAGAGGTAAGAGGASGGAGGASGGAGGAAAGAGGSGGAAADCTTFCTDEMTTCTFTDAASKAYDSAAACMSACTGFAVGVVGVYPEGPTGGNTFACRRWHLSKAATVTADERNNHCGHTKAISTQCKDN